MKKLAIVLSLASCLALTTLADLTKSFEVTNLGASNLVGTAHMMYSNSPFYLSGVTNYNLTLGQTQAVNVTFRTGWRYGRFTNYVVFTSNGGNTTNSVTGAIIPKPVANFHFTSVP